MNFDEQFSKYLNLFEDKLNAHISSVCAEKGLINEAMRYAVTGGGKRIRPVLCLALADIFDIDYDEVLPYALAIEYIHSYSLVHDDLPCMDNDDYRRGKLSTHKKFGENFGVLSGDALLNLAFETMLSNIKCEKNQLEAMKLVADYAGHNGMIKGQELDLINENNHSLDQETLTNIYINKTSKLLTAPILICSILKDYLYFDELKEFGENLGMLFQIVDDIMDVEGEFSQIGKTPKKDEKTNKFTSISFFGLEGAKVEAKKYYDICQDILSKIKGSEFLQALTNKMYLRKA